MSTYHSISRDSRLRLEADRPGAQHAVLIATPWHDDLYDPSVVHTSRSDSGEPYDPDATPIDRFRAGEDAVSFDSLTVDPSGNKMGLSLQLLLPTIILFIGSAGLAFVLLGWLLTHKTQASIGEVWRDRAFILDEGVKSKGGLEAARLMGLTISSAASSVVSIISPFLMSLYAFRIAHVWLRQTQIADSGDDSELPTPLQYGLLANMLGATSLSSLANTGRYLFRGSNKRARATYMLSEVFVVGIAVYVVIHAVSGVDVWLHMVTTTVIQPIVTPQDTPFQYSVSQNKCPPYPYPQPPEPPYQCLFQAGIWGQGLSDLAPGILVTCNTSVSLSAITLADADDLAVLVTPGVSQTVIFRATSFGARASCQSVNQLCVGTGGYFGNCSGFPSSFPPVAWNSSGGLVPGGSGAFIQSANCESCNHVGTSDMLTSGAYILSDTVPPPSNPYSLWMQFLWRSSGDGVYGYPPAGNTAVNYYSNQASMLANCSLSFYNVTVDYINGNYTLVDETLSNAGLADGLAGPTRVGNYNSRLVANIEGHAFSDNSTETVMAFLQQDLARLALGSAAVITDLKSSTLSQSTQSTRIVGRYPFWPTVILLALLFLHAVLAVIIFALTALLSRASRVRAPGATKSVSMLELTQLRLTSPLALVAALFPPVRPKASRAELSTKTDVLNIFEEHPREQRVRVGLHPNTEDKGLIFRAWRRETGIGRQGKDEDGG